MTHFTQLATSLSVLTVMACTPVDAFILERPLDADASDMTLTLDNSLALTEVDELGQRRLVVRSPNNGSLLFSEPTGAPGALAGFERLFAVRENALFAFRGNALDWQLVLGGRVPGTWRLAATSDGIIVVATTTDGLTTLTGVTRLGFAMWEAPLSGTPLGPPVIDGNDDIYVLVDSPTGPNLASFDGDGTQRWLTPTDGERLLAATADGVLVGGDALTRLDTDGNVVWAAPGEALSAVATPNDIWITSSLGVFRHAMADGVRQGDFARQCGPLVLDTQGIPTGLCGDGRLQLTRFESVARALSDGLATTRVDDSPLEYTGTLYALQGSPTRLAQYRYSGAMSASGWSRQSGDAHSQRRWLP